MRRADIRAGIVILFATLCCVVAIAVDALRAQGKPAATASGKDFAGGTEAKAAFDGVCAACHGLDGRGGERGPNITSRFEVVRKTDAELSKILRDGKPSAGMPAFASYGSAKLAGLVAYLRTLQGGSREMALPGDPVRGKALFFGRGKCAECHAVSGEGGFWARDLTNYAAKVGADEVRAAIVEPNKDLDPRRGLITVVLADATKLSGLARNEDNFSLQLQTADGTFHLLNKADVRDLTYTGRSAMPADYGSTLSPAEVNDLVSFLLRASGSGGPREAGDQLEDGDDH